MVEKDGTIKKKEYEERIQAQAYKQDLQEKVTSGRHEEAVHTGA